MTFPLKSEPTTAEKDGQDYHFMHVTETLEVLHEDHIRSFDFLPVAVSDPNDEVKIKTYLWRYPKQGSEDLTLNNMVYAQILQRIIHLLSIYFIVHW